MTASFIAPSVDEIIAKLGARQRAAPAGAAGRIPQGL